MVFCSKDKRKFLCIDVRIVIIILSILSILFVASYLNQCYETMMQVISGVVMLFELLTICGSYIKHRLILLISKLFFSFYTSLVFLLALIIPIYATASVLTRSESIKNSTGYNTLKFEEEWDEELMFGHALTTGFITEAILWTVFIFYYAKLSFVSMLIESLSSSATRKKFEADISSY